MWLSCFFSCISVSSAFANGRLTVKRLPLSGSLSTRMFPFSSFTVSDTIASPSPKPSSVTALPNRSNGVNIRCCCSLVMPVPVVICWKIRIFAYWTTPSLYIIWFLYSCDLLKNSYLCLLNNTAESRSMRREVLWFAEKFVSLLIEQHLRPPSPEKAISCDLLKNSYLCLLNNTYRHYDK